MGHQAKNSWGWGCAEWVSLVLHVVQCALKPPHDFVPDKHYCVNINWIFCKYQPGFVNTNTNLQMPVLKTYNSWYLQITGCVLCEGEPEVWKIDCSSNREYKGMPQVRVGEIYGHISTNTGSFGCEYWTKGRRRKKLSKNRVKRVVKVVAWPWPYLVFLCLIKVTCHQINIIFLLKHITCHNRKHEGGVHGLEVYSLGTLECIQWNKMYVVKFWIILHADTRVENNSGYFNLKVPSK